MIKPLLSQAMLDHIPVGVITTLDGEVYYRTNERVFVLRITHDNLGIIPCWVCAQWTAQ